MLPHPLPHSPRPTSRNYQRFVTSDHPPAATPFLLKRLYTVKPIIFHPRADTIVLQLCISTPLPHTETPHVNPPPPQAQPDKSHITTFCHKPPSPRRHTLLVEKDYIKRLQKPIIFHPRAGGLEGIRASDLEAPYQNCLVVQRPAKRVFVPPYLPPRARFFPPYVSTPLPHTPCDFVRRVTLRLAYRLAFVINRFPRPLGTTFCPFKCQVCTRCFFPRFVAWALH